MPALQQSTFAASTPFKPLVAILGRFPPGSEQHLRLQPGLVFSTFRTGLRTVSGEKPDLFQTPYIERSIADGTPEGSNVDYM